MNKLFKTKISFFIILFLHYFIPFGYSQDDWLSLESIEKHSGLLNQVASLRENGSFAEAIILINNYISDYPEILDRNQRAQLQAYKGILTWNIGKPNESRSLFLEAFRSIVDSSYLSNKIKRAIEIIDLYEKAKSMRIDGKYEESAKLFGLAIKISNEIKQKEFECKILRQLSLIYWEIDEIETFYSLNESALSIAKELHFYRDQSSCLNNIGLYFSKLDNYTQASKYYEEALALAENISYFQSQSECLTNLGVLYLDLGDYDRSLGYFNRVLEIDNNSGAIGQVIIDLNNIGTIHRKKGQQSNDLKEYENALAYFKKSLDLSDNFADERSRIRIINNLATAYSDIGSYQTSLKYYQEALSLALSKKDKEAHGSILNNIGIVMTLQGDEMTAIDYFRKAIEISKDTTNNKILWEAFLELANTYRRQGIFFEAIDYYKKAINIIEKTRISIESEELKATFFGNDKRLEGYHNLLDSLFNIRNRQQGDTLGTDVFDLIERSKARAFLDSFKISELTSSHIPKELREKENDFIVSFSKYYKELIALPKGAKRRHDIELQLESLEHEYKLFIAEFRLKDAIFAGLNFPETISLSDAKDSLLDKETMVFSYIIGKEASYGIAITKNNSKIFPIPKRKELHFIVSNYLKSLTNPDKKDFSLGIDLYRHLIEPGMENTQKRLIIIPDDILHFLPFESLLINEGSWLVSKFDISYAPSLSSLKQIKDRDRSNKKSVRLDLFAVGNSANKAKYATVEIEKIKSYFKFDKIRILVDNSASETLIKKENLENYKILHFATHGFIDDMKPERSAIQLSQQADSLDDGLLSAREIFSLRTKANLVVLSSCESGLGRLIRGEGIEGLNRAFFFAGTSAVLMSLWKVNDEASFFLMDRFYYYLKASESVVSALKKAKQDILNNSQYSHPYYWAPFVLSGDGDTKIFSHFNMVKKVSIFIGVLSFLLLIFFLSIILTTAKKQRNRSHLNNQKKI